MKISQAGQTRRDAALYAMRVLGFEDSLIRKKLNELLKIFLFSLSLNFF